MTPQKFRIAVSSSASASNSGCVNHGTVGISQQRWAFTCIALAWVIGTLVFELTAHGSEQNQTESTRPDTHEHVAPAANDTAQQVSPFADATDPTAAANGFITRMQQQHLISELMTSNLDQFLRLATNAELIAKCDAVIANAEKVAKTLSRDSTNDDAETDSSDSVGSIAVVSTAGQHEPESNACHLIACESIVPDSMTVDPVLDVMPVSKWITRVAYRELDRRNLPIGLKTVAEKRLALDQARSSALPGLMRLLVSADRKSEKPKSDAPAADKSSPTESDETVTTKIRPVSGALSDVNVVSKAVGMATHLVPTIAEPVASVNNAKQAIAVSPKLPTKPALQSVSLRNRSATKTQTAKRQTVDSQTTQARLATSRPVVVQVVPAPMMEDEVATTSPATTPATATVVLDQPTSQVEPTDPQQQLSNTTPSLAGPVANTPRREPLAQTQIQLPAPTRLTASPVDQDSSKVSLPIPPIANESLRIAQLPFQKEKPAHAEGANVSLNVQNTDVRSVLEILARGYGMNILISPQVEGVVTANIDGLTAEQTLESILKLCNLRAQVEGEAIFIYPADRLPDDAREVRHFSLDYARAEVVEPAIQGLLSPVGNAYMNKMDSQDNLRSSEAIVVVDTPESIRRIADYLYQVDQAPRQVMIEARILEVELSDTMFHGVDLSALFSGDLTVGSAGLGSGVPSTSNPLFFAQIDGSRIDSAIELLETTTDAKTLATPKVMVVNGQNARIQVGQQLGFSVATVTQTSTVQDVQFLDTGVVLSVTPTISRDNRIMMQVKPEVSSGEINPDTLLPEEETRELETSVILNNHQGVVIGGLIQENDRTVIRKLPWLGDIKHVGKLFQKREAIRSRSEIIIALVPHIIQMDEHPERDCFDHEGWHTDYDRTSNPILHGPLKRACRPWEARLPDSAANHSHLDVDRINRVLP